MSELSRQEPWVLGAFNCAKFLRDNNYFVNRNKEEVVKACRAFVMAIEAINSDDQFNIDGTEKL